MSKPYWFCILILWLPWQVARAMDTSLLKVAVLDDAPPLAFRDPSGSLTGFSVGVMQALCEEIGVRCEFQASRLDTLVDEVAEGRVDVAAVGLLVTPERQKKVLFTRTVYRSPTMLFAKPGVQPGQPGVRLATFKGSVQERYLQSKGWAVSAALSVGDMVEQLQSGQAQGCVVPLMTSFYLQKHPVFLQQDLRLSVMDLPGTDGHAAYALSPRRADLKEPLDRALDKIKRNGVYDRINSEFLPFRVN